jgi:hypothetical protein
MRAKREAQEKRQKQLSAELQSLEDIQKNQAHPHNLVIVKKSGTPVLARPAEGSRILFNAAADDEFELLDAQSDWIHVQISGASRGYIRQGSLELPDAIATRIDSAKNASISTNHDAFRVAREETNTFPGSWEPLRGKFVRIYTIKPASQNSTETSAQSKLRFASSLFQKFSSEPPPDSPQITGLVIIFDSADGGIIACTAANLHQFATGSLSEEALWNSCYLDPQDAFRPVSKP